MVNCLYMFYPCIHSGLAFRVVFDELVKTAIRYIFTYLSRKSRETVVVTRNLFPVIQREQKYAPIFLFKDYMLGNRPGAS